MLALESNFFSGTFFAGFRNLIRAGFPLLLFTRNSISLIFGSYKKNLRLNDIIVPSASFLFFFWRNHKSLHHFNLMTIFQYALSSNLIAFTFKIDRGHSSQQIRRFWYHCPPPWQCWLWFESTFVFAFLSTWWQFVDQRLKSHLYQGFLNHSECGLARGHPKTMFTKGNR